MKKLIALSLSFISVGVFAQKMTVNTEESTLKWHGEKVTGSHDGTIGIKEGWFTWENNKITEGTFVIDMTSIENTDIEDAEYKAKLEGHLKSDDFFGVENHPTATLEIKRSGKFENNKAEMMGHLTIKDITHPVEFTVQKQDNKFMTEIVVDRSKYDVRYGSGSFFDDLGDRMIYDDFIMTVMIVGEEAGM